jgi:hypothetical protein
MINRSWYSLRTLLISGISIAALGLPGVARAEEVIVVREEGPRPARFESSVYPIEIEPHFTFGPENVFGAAGFGGGLRIGIPLISGRIGRVPDNLAISFGADILHYDNCYFANDCGANYLMFPVAAQWNLFVARRVSIFLEGGAFLYKGWFDECGPGVGCAAPSNFGVLPTVAIGGRIHISRFTALTLRVGYPTTTFGLSFL